jgi:hypothetical protein
MSGIRREKDHAYFIANARGIWHALVIESSRGGIDGFLVSVTHPASNVIGPGVMRTEADAAALILAELQQQRGRSPMCMVPALCGGLVRRLYGWGLRNREIHLFQARGEAKTFGGVVMPTVMPETG